MARDRANINTNIWTDPHWRKLTRDQQWMYELILTHPELSYAGVSDWRPGRLAQFSSGTSKEDIERIGGDLQAERFILIDPDTEEVLVRSFLRHDGILKQPKLTISMVNAYGAVASNNIREVIIYELARLRREVPDLKAFENTKVLALLKHPARPMDDFTHSFTPAVTPETTQGVTPKPDQPEALPTTTSTTTTTQLLKNSSSDADAPDQEEPPAKEFPEEVHDLCNHLADLIRRNGNKANIGKGWLQAADRLIRIDGYTKEQIIWVIDWSQQNEFWQGNILSMSKLREKFDQLKTKAMTEQSAPRQQFRSAAEQRLDRGQVLLAKYTAIEEQNQLAIGGHDEFA